MQVLNSKVKDEQCQDLLSYVWKFALSLFFKMRATEKCLIYKKITDQFRYIKIKFIIGSESYENKTKEMYHSLWLSIK